MNAPISALPHAAAASPDVQIGVRGVDMIFTSGGQKVVALQGIDLDIRAGEFVCLLGPSGCGKSTLLNIIAGFQAPSTGQVLMDGQGITAPGPDRGMVFQEYALFPWMTVAKNIAFGLEIKGLSRADIADRVALLMDKLKLSEFRDRYPKDLSGGMRQRVAIARVLALDSPILLMDEPFGALDSLTRRTLQDELLRIWTEFQKTVIFVTHSIEESIYLADRIVVLTYRPGTLKRDMRVDIARPRDPSAPEFNELKRTLSTLVMDEQNRFSQDEMKSSTGD